MVTIGLGMKEGSRALSVVFLHSSTGDVGAERRAEEHA